MAIVLDGTAGITTPDLTDTSLTTGRVVYTTTSGNLTSSANLLYSGTDLTVYGVRVGRGAGTDGASVVVGANALSSATTGTSNTAIGNTAARDNTTGKDNVAIGAASFRSNISGSYNIAIGSLAMISNTTGNYNTAVGNGIDGVTQGALGLNTTGSNNTAMGYQAMLSNTTASNNTAVGYQAGYSNTTGIQNTAHGAYSLYSNSTGDYNTAIGYRSLDANTTGGYNVAVGKDALGSSTTASNSVVIGVEAGFNITTGQQNVMLGTGAGYTATTAGYNTLIGRGAGFALTTGSNNTFVGAYDPSTGASGGEITTGSNNTILGAYNGNQGGLDIRTLSNRIVLSDGDGNPRGYFNNVGDFFVGGTDIIGGASCKVSAYSSDLTNTNGIGIKNGTANTGGAFIRFINSTDATIGTISQNASTTVAYNTSSDYRLKENIAPMTGALAKVAQLKPVTYKWKSDGSDGQGFIAHELQEVVPDCVTGAKDALDKNGRPDYQGIDTSFLVATLTAAIQELKAEFDAYKSTHP
jgi:hypothetical protein